MAWKKVLPLCLKEGEELPRREDGKIKHSPAMLRLLTVIARRWRYVPRADEWLTSTARRMFFGSESALEVVAEDLTERPPKAMETVMFQALVEAKLLAAMKIESELQIFLAERKERQSRKDEAKVKGTPKAKMGELRKTSRRQRIN